MSRIALVRVEEMTPEQREQYDRFPSNLTRGLLMTERRLARALPEVANALRSSGLEPNICEVAILRVAGLCDSGYERMQHLGQAQAVGWTEAEIAAIEARDLSKVSRDLAAILTFVDGCVAAPRVSDAVFASAQSALSSRDLATLILLVGHYMMVARFTATLEIPLDPKPDPWTSEH